VPCHFSYRTHIGKPRGSLNKRTIERLKGVVEASAVDSVEARYAQSLLDGSRNGSSSQERILSRSTTASSITERSSLRTTSPSPNEQLEVPAEELSLEVLDASLNNADSLSDSELQHAVAAGVDEVNIDNSKSTGTLTDNWIDTAVQFFHANLAGPRVECRRANKPAQRDARSPRGRDKSTS
jgi:hypothetical protein